MDVDPRTSIERLRRRLAEVAALKDVSDPDDTRLDIAERNMVADIRDIFGPASHEFETHEGHTIWRQEDDSGPLLSRAERLAARKAGITHTTTILESLMRRIEEKAEIAAATSAPREQPKDSGVRIGDWRVLEPLRRGGQGEVLLVERLPPKQYALGVLKRVPANVSDDQKRLGRLKHEIETIRALRHPFIAELLDLSFGELWFVTRHAALGSLADHLAWFRGDIWRTLRMARDVATALQVAHEKGVIHRDVKPGNILLHDPDHIALTDFGIAHDADQTEVTGTHERVGAQWFRPPESEHGRFEPTPAFDVYMLGKVIYNAFTGGGRFPRERFMEGSANVITIFSRPELKVMNKLWRSMIVEAPEQRFQSMSEVITAIDATLTRLSGGVVSEGEHRLIFMFGEQGGNRYSGNHPGLTMVPIWMPAHTTRLTLDLRVHSGVDDPQFGLELWDKDTKVFDSGRLQEGRNGFDVPADIGGRWLSLNVGKGHGWGTANISNLVVHAVCAHD